jgi:endo-1,4-beta-xylanase
MKKFLLKQDYQQSRNVSTKVKYLSFVTALLLLINPALLVGQIAKDKCKFLGSVIPGSVPSDFATYWNQVTPENGGKWGSVEGTQDVMNWANLDLAYNYAKGQGFPFKQHTFVWGQQQPDWIGGLTQAQQLEEVEEWIKSYCERFPATDYIDVVNEPLHAVPSYSGALGGAGSTGWDWVIWAFEKARQYCPNAKLALNDYNIISNNSATDQYLQIINLLKARNLIDVIGEQGHFLETTPMATITANLNKLDATDIPIHISEYDVNISNDNDQSLKYQEQFSVLWRHPGVQGITLWGYKQGQIWRTDAYLVRSAGTERPAMTWLKSYVPGVSGGTFCFVTGLEDDQIDIKVYPNPSPNGKITIETSYENTEVEIMDMHGKSIRQVKVSNEKPVSLDLTVSPGVYVLKTSNVKGQKVRKIIIQ